MRWSKYSLWVCLAVIIVIRLFIAPLEGILTWDVFGYYLYLPAYFIYDDLTLQNIDWVQGVIDTYHTTGTFYQGVQLDSGEWVMRYPSGMAILNAPFFFLAHFLAEPLGFVADGFSKPYQAAWSIGSLFYTVLGLLWSRKLFLKYFNEGTAAILLLLLVLGTNLVQMATYGNPLPHIVLFSGFAFVLLELSKWGDRVSRKSAFKIGLTVGIMGILRPNEVVILLIPFLWNMKGLFRDRWNYLTSNIGAVFTLAIGFAIGLLPQLIYWKAVSGQWLYYSYQDPGVGFDFLNPHTWDFLFSYRKGWFVYTPLMFVACLGFILLARKRIGLFIPFLIYFLVNLYIVSSWSVWWYAGGSYSSRSMISSLVLMAIPLGFVVDWVRQQTKWIRWGGLILGVFMIVLNLFQFWQFRNGVLTGERNTGAYYWKVFGSTTVPEGAEKLLLVERQATAYEHMPADHRAFDSSVIFSLDPKDYEQYRSEQIDGKAALELNAEQIYSPEFRMNMEDITNKEYAWLKIRGKVYLADSISDEPPLLVTSFIHKDRFRNQEAAYKYTTSENQGKGVVRGTWHTIEMDYMTPEVRSQEDDLKVYFWYRGKNPVYISEMEVVKYVPKD